MVLPSKIAETSISDTIYKLKKEMMRKLEELKTTLPIPC